MSERALEGFERAANEFHREVARESAGTLGRAGRKVEEALAALRAFEGERAARDRLVKAAADAVYNYLIQREACGFRNQDEAIATYEVPNEVLARVGGR